VAEVAVVAVVAAVEVVEAVVAAVRRCFKAARQHFEAAKEEVRQELHRMIYQKQCPWIGRKVGRMLGVNV
jgi:hypothetical protein